MNKIAAIIFSLAIIFAGSDSFSQGAPKPNFGAKGGLNLANIGGDETDNKMKLAFHAGVYSEVFFDYFLMMQAEILLSYQGHAAVDEFSGSLSLWYLNIPILARYNIGYNLNVHAGIQPGFLLSAQSKYTDSFSGDVIKLDQKDFFKTMDWGIPVGVGYSLGDRNINASIRYIIPISNISADDFFTRRNSVFQISVGIKIATIDNL